MGAGILCPIGVEYLVRVGHRIWYYVESNLGYRIGNILVLYRSRLSDMVVYCGCHGTYRTWD